MLMVTHTTGGAHLCVQALLNCLVPPGCDITWWLVQRTSMWVGTLHAPLHSTLIHMQLLASRHAP
jgi:hypothetical protein